MKSKKVSLRKQFLTRMLTVLFIITAISGVMQIYFINYQANYDIATQASLIAQSIDQGIKETNLASKSIEEQIDLKLIADAKNIVDILNKDSVEDISNEELVEIRDKLGLSAISVFKKNGEDIVVVRATDPDEIGYEAGGPGSDMYKAAEAMFNGENPQVPGAYNDKGLLVLPSLQSEVHDEPKFFKYAYWKEPGTDYLLNPYIEAQEVYRFTEEVGPNAWIDKMKNQNTFIREIAVLNPKVFQNPELEKQAYPILKKVEYGEYLNQTEEDTRIIKKMVDNPVKQTTVQKVKGEKLLNIFLPVEDGQVIYISLDYNQMIGPIYRHSIILVISGFISLLALFLLTIKFFDRIYENIQKIIKQIRLLEKGDLTVKSEIRNGGELSSLSITTNIMVDNLNQFMRGTQELSVRTQLLSEKLEIDASHSVEKIYEISAETTMKARQQLYEITEFLNAVEQALLPHKDNKQVGNILEKMDSIREVANERTATTTNVTITLSDLLKSLYGQSRELSEISSSLLEQMSIFKL